MGKSLRIGTLIPLNLLNNPLAFCSLINLEFLLPQTSEFDESIILPFLIFSTFGFLFPVFFSAFQSVR